MKLYEVLLLATVVVLLSAVALMAYAQSSGTVHAPVGVRYELRFTAKPGTTAVCIHEVTAGPSVEFVDRDHDGAITQADAFGCSSSVVADDATPNAITLEMEPPLVRSVTVSARAYDGTGPTDPGPSGPSNWHVLAAVLGAPTLLD